MSTIERLADALRELDPDASFDDLRDVLWLAQHLPEARATEATHRQTSAGARGSSRSVPQQPPAPNAPAAVPSPDSRRNTAGLERRRVSDPASSAQAYAAATQAGALPVGRAARRVRLRAPPPLPDALGLARALRPLGRRRQFGPSVELDEVASAERIAETGLPLPLLRQRRGRWFEVALLIERTTGLAAWRAQIRAFERLLQRQGGFRQVVTLVLDTEHDSITLRSASGRTQSPGALLERNGRRLVIVISDCTASAWHDGRVGAWLAPLAERMPLALVQPFEPAIWPHTALGFVDLAVRAPVPGAATGALDVRRPEWAEGEAGLVLPVLGMRAAEAGAWARMVAAAGGAWAPAALLPMAGARPLNDDPISAEMRAALVEDASPAGAATAANLAPGLVVDDLMRLEAFRAAADPAARQLAAGLSAVDPLTLPVMRIVQHAIAPQGGASALAQVLASGLFRPLAALTEDNEDEVGFQLDAAVRERLGAALPRSDWQQVLLAIGRAIEQETGDGVDLLAVLEDDAGIERLPPAARAFAEFTRKRAARYASDAQVGHTVRGWVDELVVGDGLTLRATRLVSTAVRRLVFAPDGRLAVQHAVGVDVMGARPGEDGGRLRRALPRGQPQWAMAGDERAIRDLVAACEREAEADSGRPVESTHWTVEEALERPALPLEMAGAQVLLLTHRHIPPGEAGRQRLRDTLRMLRDDLGWVLLPLDDTALGVMPDLEFAAWVGALARPLDSEATRAAVASLLPKLVETLPVERRKFAGIGWMRAGDQGSHHLASVEQFADTPWTINAPPPFGETPLPQEQVLAADAGDGGVAAIGGDGMLWMMPAAANWQSFGTAAASDVRGLRCDPAGQRVAAVDAEGRLHVVPFGHVVAKSNA